MTLALLASVVSCKDRGTVHVSGAISDSVASSLNEIGDTSAPASHGGHRYGPPTGKIRVANLLEIDGKPSGPLDFYDVRKPDSDAKPIISHLAYGTISDYVSPRAGDPCAGCSSNLYLFPAGLKATTKPFGGNIDNGGFNSTDQLTLALGPSKGFSGGTSVATFTIAEAGKKLEAARADSETAIQGSQALLIVHAANTSADSMPEQYLMIDGACPHAANDNNVMGDKVAFAKQPSNLSNTLLYPVAAGAHTLAIVTSPRGHGLLTCTGQTPGATTSLSVEAGKRYVVWAYGVPSDGLKVVAAPVAAP